MPNFNAVAHLVRPAERGQTYRYTSKEQKNTFPQKWPRFARTKVAQLNPIQEVGINIPLILQNVTAFLKMRDFSSLLGLFSMETRAFSYVAIK